MENDHNHRHGIDDLGRPYNGVDNNYHHFRDGMCS